MKGYFISEESYKKFGLDKNPEFNACTSKTVIVVTEDDFEGAEFTLTDEQKLEFASWWCNEYMDGLIEFASQFGEPTDEKNEEDE